MPSIPEPVYKNSTQSTVKAWRERFGRYGLRGSACTECGTEYYPRRSACARCHSTKVADKDLPKTGTVLSYTVDFYPLMAYGQQLPIVIAAIQLGDSGPVVKSIVVDTDPWQVKVGDRVEMVVRRLRRESNGNYQYGHKFKKVENQA